MILHSIVTLNHRFRSRSHTISSQQRLLARAAEPQASLRRRPGAPRARERSRPSSSASKCGRARSRHRAASVCRSAGTPPMKNWLGMAHAASLAIAPNASVICDTRWAHGRTCASLPPRRAFCFVLCFDGNALTVTAWALRAQTPTPTVRPWLGRVAGVSVRRMRTRWRAYTRFAYVT